VVDARRHGHLHAEVARELHEHHVILGLRPALDQAGGAVGRAVVHVDDLNRSGHLGDRLAEAPVELGQPGLLVEDGHDDRQERARVLHAGRL
jgi:hypothetical protein